MHIRTWIRSLSTVLGMVFLVCSNASNLRAAPVTYTVTWTLESGGPAPLTSTYTYDDVTNAISDMYVPWNGFDSFWFDLDNPTIIAIADRPLFQAAMLVAAGNTWTARTGPAFSGADISDIKIWAADPLLRAPSYGQFSTSGAHALTSASGTFTVTASSVPEPATLTLAGLGMACLLVGTMRGRARRKANNVKSSM